MMKDLKNHLFGRFSILPGLAILVLCLSSCATDRPLKPPSLFPHVGKYYSAGDLRYFTILKQDGTFVVRGADGDMAGTYHVRNTTLLLTLEHEGVSLLGHIRGRTIVDNNGKKWIRPPYNFTDRMVRKQSLLDMHKRMPRGWLLRFWEGRYGICRRPKGPPPSYLDAEAMLIILRHGESDALANAENMIADTPGQTIHLSMAPGGSLWPTATEDLLKVFLEDTASRKKPERAP